jgi:hypothetical protein
MLVLPPFTGPHTKIARANKHIAEFSDAVESFGKSVILNFEGFDAAPDSIEWHPRFSAQLPVDFPVIMGDAIHNLRTALDNTVCDLARVRELKYSDLKYPFAKNLGDLNEKLAKMPYARLGEDIIDALRTTRPYKVKEGGHVGLRGLHDLDILDKHTIALPIYLIARAKVPIIGEMMKKAGFKGNFDFRYPVHEESKITLRKDLQPINVLDFSQTKPEPVFPKGLPFAEKPVLEVLKGLAKLTEQIVTAFERKFGRRDMPASTPPSGNHLSTDGGD